ncbi:DUF664 domain-containing protein [Lapillicoccus jejuensis]|uniref:Uncharacterized protein DUF664 n=1 Tax=Lapillicoccus jejuensis TaxID=402171 RepID=A0A542DZE0_9MICO|nr:DUF664 domain-containing protein [Lapillicoccus jejuensis]TQJ08455.1 uncharacterized protein DUF664 [Lapillicoccus jejuensis]
MSDDATTGPAEPHVDPPWEPPTHGTEVEHLLGALDRLRTTFRWKADGLDQEGLAARVGASSLSLAALLKHLAVVEDTKSTRALDGSPLPDVWEGNGWDDDPDWELTSAPHDEPADLYARYDDAVARSRARFAAALAAGGLDQRIALGAPEWHVSLRRLLFDLVEEYGRHTGHADLLREAVDGRTGEDPEPGWRPACGHYAFH